MVKAQVRELAAENSPTQTLAEYVSTLTYKKIPQEVIAHIKLCLIDSLGCALFGSTLPWGKIITAFTKEMGKGKGALDLGRWRGGSEHERAAGQRHADSQFRDGRSAPCRRDPSGRGSNPSRGRFGSPCR